MTYMLDTNICIYGINNRPKAAADQIKEHLKAYRKDGVCISTVALAELEFGASKSNYTAKSTAVLLQFLSVVDVVPFGRSAAIEYGRIRAYLQKRGTPIGPMDMLIAAHAMAENLVLVTNNVREEARVPDLRIENWAE